MDNPVLIAVPDLLFRSKIAGAARQANRAFVSAATSEGILARLDAEGPTLVVIDLGDERIDPFGTIRRIKSDPATRDVTVVGFFSHVRIDLRDAARSAGCDHIVPRSALMGSLSALLGAASAPS